MIARYARKLLTHYRLARADGYTPAQARGIAEFMIVVKRHGKNDHTAQNLLRKYRKDGTR